jgi:repressor LexA
MRKEITETQKKVFRSITDFVEERGFPPTIREIMSLMGYSSVNNVQRILSVLEKNGYINRNLRGGARCIEVVERPASSIEDIKKIPILGRVAAGTPLFAEQNVEGFMTFNPQLTGIDADFILRISGDSMKDAYINNNDLIFVRKMNFPNNNDIIVALLDEEATVKRFFKEQDHVRLQPENPDYKPIIINKNDLYFKILGKVIAIIHKI